MPSPRWSQSPRVNAQQEGGGGGGGGGGGERPGGAQANLFVNDTNHQKSGSGRQRKGSTAVSIRQQAMEELAQMEMSGRRSGGHNQNHNNHNSQHVKQNRTVSAGVAGACITPTAGLSRTLPPLQQLKEIGG
ncbi:hypothetical protein ScalyP_jg120, partial [Parmales sp. scaly parma]